MITIIHQADPIVALVIVHLAELIMVLVTVHRAEIMVLTGALAEDVVNLERTKKGPCDPYYYPQLSPVVGFLFWPDQEVNQFTFVEIG